MGMSSYSCSLLFCINLGSSAFRSKHNQLQPLKRATHISSLNQQSVLMEGQKIQSENEIQRKPRILCLHGFRTSGKILGNLISRWPENVTGELDLVFPDAPFPARGKSDVEGIFDPPYFEWFHSDQDFKQYFKFEECLNYLEDYMLKHGPFDGVLGFSQGAILAAGLPGMQNEGVALVKVPKIKFLIIISGAKFGGSKFGLPELAANAFSSPVNCPSLHIIGEHDFLKDEGKALLSCFVDPLVIYHPKGHTVPRLIGEDLERMMEFIQNIKDNTQLFD